MLKLRVKQILKERNMTSYWLAEKIGMSYNNLTNMVNNKTSSIRFNVLEKLSDTLNCSFDELFERVTEENK